TVVVDAERRIDQRCDIFEERSSADDASRFGDISRETLESGPISRRSGEMSDLHSRRAHECEVLGPEIGLQPIDEPRNFLEAAAMDRLRRREPERRGMDDDRDVL